MMFERGKLLTCLRAFRTISCLLARIAVLALSVVWATEIVFLGSMLKGCALVWILADIRLARVTNSRGGTMESGATPDTVYLVGQR